MDEGGDGGDGGVIRLVPDADRAMSPAEVVAHLPALLEAVIVAAHSSPREGERVWRVISHRNGLQSEGYTLDQVGTGLSITRERVRQIQKVATEELVNPARTRGSGPDRRAPALLGLVIRQHD